VSQSNDRIFNLQCLFNGYDGFDDSDIPSVYYNLIVFAVLPPALFGLIFVVWVLYSWLSRNIKDLKGKILSSFIVFLFLIHPSITKGVFSIFNCVEVEGVKKVQSDMSQECYGQAHWYYVKNASIPSIVMWVVGLPLGALWAMLRNGKYLEKIEKDDLSQHDLSKLAKIASKYRFLYSGFHAEHYYWEIVIVFRKVLMIAAGVFLQMVTAQLQILIMMSLMTLSLSLHLKSRPYHSTHLNTLETSSHLVALVTLYTGLFYQTSAGGAHANSDAHWFFFTLLMMTNVLFLL